MSDLLKNLVGALIPSQSYTVGGKSVKSSGVPVELTLKLDPEFSKTILKATGIIGGSIVLGMAAGYAISDNRKRGRR